MPGVVADADDLALLASMSKEERSAVLRRLRKMQKEAEKQQQVGGWGVVDLYVMTVGVVDLYVMTVTNLPKSPKVPRK